MTPSESHELISKAGGPAAFAKLLGIDGERWAVQRVSNWQQRGIPAKVVLENLNTIESLRRQES